MEVDESRQQLGSGKRQTGRERQTSGKGRVNPDPERPGRSGQRSVLDARHRRFRTRQLHELHET